MTGEDAAAVGGAGSAAYGEEIGDVLAETVFKRSYARVLPDGRRETWAQAVDRSVNLLKERGLAMIAKAGADPAAFLVRMGEVREAMLAREVMPSMRLFWSAGLSTNDISFFNCASVGSDSPAVFWEALYVLMHGTGQGYSVEEDLVALLPVPEPPRAGGGWPVHVVGDSKEGWRDAVEVGVLAWFRGDDVVFDYSQVRPKGAPLKTSGGQASGPDPLRVYLDDLRAKIQAAGRQRRGLTTVECSDLLCRAGQAVHVGGVRRSAMIGLFSPKDSAMASIKDWTEYAPRSQVARLRGQVNISALTDDPLGQVDANGLSVLSRADFDRMWHVLADGRSGEPGIISSFRNRWRLALPRLSDAVRALTRIGFNPCVEIALLLRLRASREASFYDGGGQFCNLTTAPLRPGDTLAQAQRKVELAAFIGTIQAGLTDFKGLRAAWKENTDRDALLGVCLSSHADCMEIATDAEAMKALNRAAIAENERWAPILGVNVAAAVTAVKPDGNSAQVLGAASGFHGYYSEHFLRRVAIDSGSPIARLLLASGFPAVPSDRATADALAAGRISAPDVASWSFEFPRRAPAGALIAESESALDQVRRYLTVLESYTGERGHNVSATIYVKPHEWDELGEWVWAHIDRIGGLSFYPVEDHGYHAAPLEALTAEQYAERLASLPDVDWSRLAEFENGVSEGAQTFACAGGACSIV